MTSPIAALGLTYEEGLAALRDSAESGSGVFSNVYRAVFETGRLDFTKWGLKESSVRSLEARFHARLPEVVRTIEEPNDRGVTTIKAILRTHDGLEIESVRIPMGGEKQSLCISSQVGCKLACAFCETGRMGLIRHLTADEIVGQVVVARTVLGWPIKNVVFMGMGEPLDNRANVFQAIRVLQERRGLSMSQTQLTVCTAGHVEGIDALRSLGLKRLGFSLSLNGARDELRDRLMPVNRKSPLAEVQAALLRYREAAPKLAFGINYCLLPGINDADADARAVADFCRPLGKLMVNVIPYNPGHLPLTRSPTPDEISRFLRMIQDLGLPVRQREPRGRSVMAACGQLGNVELRGALRRGRGSVET